MPLPTSINDLSTTVGSNSPAGTENPQTFDDYLRWHASFIAALRNVVISGTASVATLNIVYTGTLAGSTGVVNIGSGQIYKDSSGNVMIGGTNPATYGKFAVAGTNGTMAYSALTAGFGDLTYGGGPGNIFRVGPAAYADGGVALMYTTSGSVRTEGARLKSTGQMNFVGLAAAPAGAEGDVYFDSVTKKHRGHDGTSWNDLY